MVIAALIVFAVLLIAWIFAPSGATRRPAVEAIPTPAPEARLAEAA
jgi:hypothetical protein